MTALDSINRALLLLGVAPIAAVTDQTQAARTAHRQFEHARQSVLSEYPWAFAIRVQALSTTSYTDNPPWLFRSPRPGNALAIWEVTNERNRSVQFLIENNFIFTNIQNPSVEFSVDVPFESWDSASKEAFCHRLAADCAVTLTGSEQIAQAMLQKYIMFGTLARRNSRNERDTDVKQSGTYIAVRRPGVRA